MVIKTSTVYKMVMFVIAMFMLEYFDIVLPSMSVSLSRITLLSVAIVMTLLTLLSAATNPELKHRLKFANFFFRMYIPVIVITAVLSMIWYRYSLMSIITVTAPYFYPLYAYPLIYIFYRDNTYEKYMKVISLLVIAMLALKAFAWYMYNYHGKVFFSAILFRHGDDWARNGTLRIDTGALFGVVICFMLCMFFVRKKRRALLFAGGMALFAIFITQYRFVEIVIILAGLVIYLTSSGTSKSKLIRILLITTLVIAFIAFGGLDAVLSSFSVESKEGGSTEARYETIEFFWGLMNVRRFFFGYGYITTYSSAAMALVTRSATEVYWLEDIGILGGFFMYGLMSLALYIPLFYSSVKSALLSVRIKSPDRAFLSGIVSYMIISCIMLNIFDRQRVFDTAFFIALISFISAVDSVRIDSRPRLEPHAEAAESL